MTLELEATYADGMLKPERPLPLIENQKVIITVREKVSRAARSYGLLRWTGGQEDLDYLTRDPENGLWESP